MTRIGYMCAVDLEFHVGEDLKPARVYSSAELAIEGRKCVRSCGLVEVEITLKQCVIEPNYEYEATSASHNERTNAPDTCGDVHAQ